MASKKISELQACTAPASTDKLILAANSGSNTEYCTANDFLNNTAANISSNVITANILIVTDNTTPSNSTANVTFGRMWSDGNYLYIATATNVIKRITLDTF